MCRTRERSFTAKQSCALCCVVCCVVCCVLCFALSCILCCVLCCVLCSVLCTVPCAARAVVMLTLPHWSFGDTPSPSKLLKHPGSEGERRCCTEQGPSYQPGRCFWAGWGLTRHKSCAVSCKGLTGMIFLMLNGPKNYLGRMRHKVQCAWDEWLHALPPLSQHRCVTFRKIPWKCIIS